MRFHRNSIITIIIILAAIVIIFASLSKMMGGKDNITLAQYASQHPDLAYAGSVSDSDSNTSGGSDFDSGSNASGGSDSGSGNNASGGSGSDKSVSADTESAPSPVGASLNVGLMEERVTYEDGFYYEPLSDRLQRYITGVSYPADAVDVEIGIDELRYLHIMYIDFDGNPTEGELICNEAVAQDLAEIFYELYLSEYAIERVRLIDEYDGDDNASMEDNNTSCFNYRMAVGTNSLSKHALGLAVDINPLYNPYITYKKDGSVQVLPASAEPYSDRSGLFPYKIDETDLCYKLFLEHGFTWGGNWNSSKDYQHFQKALNK